MVEQEFKIIVKTDVQLTVEERRVIAQNFVNRLEGYTTKTPKCLKGAKINLNYNIDEQE